MALRSAIKINSMAEMANYWLLRIHRWIALTFSIPLAVILVTGIVLSFEPLFLGSENVSVTTESVLLALKKFDAENRARFVAVNGYQGTLSFGTSPRNATLVDLSTNEKVLKPQHLASLFSQSRRLHQTLVFELDWLVTCTTFALVAIIAMGAFMGLPRIRNSLSGWHKATAWFLLPLLTLSPITGLLLAFHISFAPAATPIKGPLLTMPAAITAVTHTFAAHQIVWVRSMSGRLVARVNDDGELRVFEIASDRLIPASRNWPRLLHEGTWSRMPAFVLNMLKSAGLALLIVTGFLIWLRRSRRQKTRSEV